MLGWVEFFSLRVGGMQRSLGTLIGAHLIRTPVVQGWLAHPGSRGASATQVQINLGVLSKHNIHPERKIEQEDRGGGSSSGS